MTPAGALPIVSVVIPVHRSERFILATLDSVFAQRDCGLEVIVVDDGSPDGSHDLLQPLAGQGRIRYLRQPNRGMAAARNAGLAQVRSEFVAFLDHDDRWPEDKLAWQAAYLRGHPDVVLVGGRSQWIDEAGAVLGMYGAIIGELSRETLFHANHLAGPGGTLMRTAAVRAVGGFDASLFGTDDWDLYLRLCGQGRIVHLDRVALHSIQHPAQSSRDLPRMAQAARRTLWQNLQRLEPAERWRLASGVQRAYRRIYGWVHLERARALWREGRPFAAARLYFSLWDWRGPEPRGAALLRPPTVPSGAAAGRDRPRGRLREGARRHLTRARRIGWRFACTFTSPAPRPGSDAPEVHSLLCHAHVAMALASAKSFDLAAGLAARFVIHDDGSLNGFDRWLLTRALPGCRVISRAEADARAEREAAHLPSLKDWRRRCLMTLKLIDVALWSEAPVLACIDSDVLFFRAPEALLAALGRPAGPALFNRDLSTNYLVDVAQLSRAIGGGLLERANAGLWVMPRAALSLEVMERWASHPLFAPHLHEGSTEQAMAALLGSVGPGGATHLPAPYDLSADPIGTLTVCRHYAGALRHGYAEDGLPYLFGPLAFRKRWRAFVAGKAAFDQRDGLT